jgi:hypothetical protein
MGRPWWKDLPTSEWTEEDWKAWWHEGSPRLPRRRPPELGNSPVIPPPGPKSAVSTLFPKPRGREVRGAQSRAFDRLLDHLGAQPRRRAR